MSMIPISKAQKEIMAEFYAIPATNVLFKKRERTKLWKQATARQRFSNFEELTRVCPALAHQIQKSYECGKNIQSAVFSECVYAQTFANMLELKNFVNCEENPQFLSVPIHNLLTSYHLRPRYAYSNASKSRMLIQAGGCNGVDSALITVLDWAVYTIEFKEPGAKTSEPDLPKYGEDGQLKVTKDFLKKYSQFQAMLEEQKSLNFFEMMGHNINNFSPESIHFAVANNYTKKYADVICTEDKHGILVMPPCNQVNKWARLEGEIRPAGRNHYNVWTPNALKRFLREKNAIVNGMMVTVKLETLQPRLQRGGNGRASGYKINPLFFIYSKHCTEEEGKITFDIREVQQLNPTIAGKMFFDSLEHRSVKESYGF